MPSSFSKAVADAERLVAAVSVNASCEHLWERTVQWCRERPVFGQRGSDSVAAYRHPWKVAFSAPENAVFAALPERGEHLGERWFRLDRRDVGKDAPGEIGQ